jgi:hypothetical protein
MSDIILVAEDHRVSVNNFNTLKLYPAKVKKELSVVEDSPKVITACVSCFVYTVVDILYWLWSLFCTSKLVSETTCQKFAEHLIAMCDFRLPP